MGHVHRHPYRSQSGDDLSGNLGGGFKGGDLDLKELTANAAWLLSDNQRRGRLGEPAWDASQQTRIEKAMRRRPATAEFHWRLHNLRAARWRNVTGNATEADDTCAL